MTISHNNLSPLQAANNSQKQVSLPPKFPGLDGLRAIFCIGIVLYHVNESFQSPFPSLLNPIYHYGGYFGNYTFFIISGLLIACHYKIKIFQKEIHFTAYIGKRIWKIYPLYFLSNLALVLLLLLQNDIASLSMRKLCGSFLMMATGWFFQDTPYNLPTWFICVLLLCYILYYCVTAISSRFPKLYMPLCIFLIILGAVLETGEWNVPFLYRTNGEGYMNFFIGTMLAEIYTHSGVKKDNTVFAHILYLAVTLAAVIFCGFDWIPFDKRWVITLICGNLICMAICLESFTRLLSWPLLQKIGKQSRAIYMWHVPVVHWLFYLENKIGLSTVAPLANFILYFILLFALAELSCFYIEKKMF